MNDDLLLFLLLKPRPKLVGPTCVSRMVRDRLAGHTITTGRFIIGEAGPCRQPVWKDDLCSDCWHCSQMHGAYTMMKANPAAASLGWAGIERLTFHERGPELPATGAGVPDTVPAEWER